MSEGLTFEVYGIAQPQGSARAFMPKGARYPVVTSDNPKLKAWRDLIAGEASRALHGTGRCFDGPIRICAAFYLPRPKSLAKKGDVPHITRPDVDKLARSVGDALTGVVYRDDAQIVQLKVEKYYAAAGESPRAVIRVDPV